ncbi:unnamed protein product [Linum trigynum]|uniref:PPM-type phosphatase domain-containing protein n=1 Tax=Linum trigynum TaxID=586398 RepID=A0AAV2GK29_9ROSI
MGLKDLHLKLKALRLRRLLIGHRKKRRGIGSGKKPSWMRPISHGYHVVEDQPSRIGREAATSAPCDSVVVQREQVEEIDLWFFGVFDTQTGDRITKHLQSHLFDKLTKESQVRRKSKEAIRKAYLSAKAKIREGLKPDEILRIGSASAMVINAEKLLVASMGDYRAVVCRDGVAHDSGDKHSSSRRHWTRRLFSGWNSGSEHKKVKGSSELGIRVQKIDSDTEFVIIGSNGIWEVMKKQEAVSLIRHMENPQEAAECLTMEALTRMSKSCISCLVIRFD